MHKLSLQSKHILTVNGGSSSIKFALFEHVEFFEKIVEGEIKGIGSSNCSFQIKGIKGFENFSEPLKVDFDGAVRVFIDRIEQHVGWDGLSAVGHRIVHGGQKYLKEERINEEMINELRKLNLFDPEHLNEELLLAEYIFRHFPKLPQVACFDTAFHHSLPRVAQMLPIPRRYEAQGVRRYGFHGLSYEFITEELLRIEEKSARGRAVLAHLGNGASLCALREGKSVDTSMSFTPTGGIPMSTRSGDLDPGFFRYLAETEGCDAKGFSQIVNFQSGLLGMSEISPDMRELIDREKSDVRAAEAIAVFCYQVKKWIGGFSAILGGLDTLVFTGGIGENAPLIRSRICEGLEFLGIKIEEKLNRANERRISAKGTSVAVYVIRTDEEIIIAKNVYKVLDLD